MRNKQGLLKKVTTFDLLKDEYLQEFMCIKYYYVNKKHIKFKDMYDRINKKYTDKLKEIDKLKQIDNKEEKEQFIKFEKYRLQNNKFSIESNTNGFLLALLTLVATMAITTFESMSVFNDTIKCIIFLVYLLIVAPLEFLYFIDNKNVKIYDLAIKVLEDIEQENAKEKSKTEIEQIVNEIKNNGNAINKAMQEIATTNDKKIDQKADKLIKSINSIKNSIRIKNNR